MMVARAGNHPHHLMTREPHAQCEGISIVVPPTHAEMGTTRILVHVYCIPHTHSQTCGNEHITNRYHLSTTPTYPHQGTRPYKKQSGPAIGNTMRAEHPNQASDVSNPSGQSVHRQIHTCARNGRSPQSAHSSEASGCPQSACMLARPPERVGRTSHKKSLIYYILWFANSSVAGAPGKRGQCAAATAAQTAGRSPRPRTRSTKENIEAKVGEHTGTRTVTKQKDGEYKTLTRQPGTAPQHGGTWGANWSE